MKRTGGPDAGSEDRGGSDRVGQDRTGQVVMLGGQETFIGQAEKTGGEDRL